MDVLAEGSEDGDVSSLNASVATVGQQVAAQQELAKIREFLLQQQQQQGKGKRGEEDEEEEEEEYDQPDLLGMIKTLMSQAATAQAAAFSSSSSTSRPGLSIDDEDEDEDEDGGEDATVQLPSMSELQKLQALMEEKDEEVATLREERNRLQADMMGKAAELEAAHKALEEAMATKSKEEEEEDGGDDTVMLDPEMQRLMAGMAERDAEMGELRAALAAAEEEAAAAAAASAAAAAAAAPTEAAASGIEIKVSPYFW